MYKGVGNRFGFYPLTKYTHTILVSNTYYTVMNRLPTGVTNLDRNIEGGIPAGTLVVIKTDPSTQGELLLKQLASQHDTLYLSTLRTEPDIRTWLDTNKTTPFTNQDSPTRIEYTAMDTPVEAVKEHIGMESEQMNIIVDSVNTLETENHSKYVSMLHGIKTHLANTDSICVLHMLKGEGEPENRSVTLALADMVWDVEQERNGTDIDTHLKIPKCRSGVLPDKISKIDLGRAVSIDTSRDIA